MTNVASYCGYTTSHYSAYVELLEEYGEDLVILAFPCNEFGEQEPEVSENCLLYSLPWLQLWVCYIHRQNTMAKAI